MKKLTTVLFILVFASSMAFAQNNTATSTTNGSNNTSTITQDGSANAAEVMQSGNSNEATVDQGIQGITSNNDEASITQAGNGNSAELDSRDGWGESPNSVVYDVDQEGNHNSVDAVAFNAPAEADVDQSGSGNSANLTQTQAADMSVNLTQSGTYNSAEIYQETDNAVLEATFDGSHNSMDVEQTGSGAWQKLVVGVSGSSNSITGTLGGHDADQFTEIMGDGNDFDFYQDESSDAGISVSGNYNDIDLAQNGVHNSVFATNPWEKDGIVINGSSNNVGVTQNSDYNTATVNVSGTHNSANITQN